MGSRIVRLAFVVVMVVGLTALVGAPAGAEKAQPTATCTFHADAVYTELVDITVSWSGRDPDYITPDESIRWAVTDAEKAANHVEFTGASIIGSTVYFASTDPIELQFDKVTQLHTHTYVTFATANCAA